MRGLSWHKQSDETRVLLEWHASRDEDRAGFAVLRRARSVEDVAFCPAYHRLLHTLRAIKNARVEPDDIARVAGLAARTEQHDADYRLPERMATPRTGQTTPCVSDLRFRRLLAIEDPEDLFLPLLRVIALLRGEANLLDVARAVCRNAWTPRLRKEWAHSYYEVAQKHGKNKE